MRRTFAIPSNLASFIVATLLFAFLFMPQGRDCWAEEKGDNTFTVRVLSPKLEKSVKVEMLVYDETKKNEEDITSNKYYSLTTLDAAQKNETVIKRETTPGRSGSTFTIAFYAYDGDTGRRCVKSSTVEGRPGSEVVVEYALEQGIGGIRPKITSCVETYIILDKVVKSVEIKESMPIRVARGATERKKEEYTVKHSVSIQTGWKGELEVKGEMGIKWKLIEGTIGGSIRGQIERSENKTYEESKTTTREVEIQGGNSPVKLVWIETFRTGKAVTTINGKMCEIPFKFREGWDLQTREVKE